MARIAAQSHRWKRLNPIPSPARDTGALRKRTIRLDQANAASGSIREDSSERDKTTMALSRENADIQPRS
jgi:hypothetical protein